MQWSVSIHFILSTLLICFLNEGGLSFFLLINLVLLKLTYLKTVWERDTIHVFKKTSFWCKKAGCTVFSNGFLTAYGIRIDERLGQGHSQWSVWASNPVEKKPNSPTGWRTLLQDSMLVLLISDFKPWEKLFRGNFEPTVEIFSFV
jgi:hypothetical protein